MVTLESYPGVEFKTHGAQVVIAGSVHPESGKHYAWDDNHPNIAEVGFPAAPQRLISLIKRPPMPESSGGGEYTPAKLGEVLELLDATDFQDQDKWLRMMMSCHHATAGDGRTEFVEWSISDPQYAGDADYIGRRWDSLHKEKAGGVTAKTLNMYLRDAGYAHKQAPRSIGDDFDDDLNPDDYNPPDAPDEDSNDPFALPGKAEADPFALGGEADDGDGVPDESQYTPEAETLLNQFNKKFWMLNDKIIWKEHDPFMKRDIWESMRVYDFKIKHSNIKVMRNPAMLSKNQSPYQKLGEAWVEWDQRRDVIGARFDPSSAQHPGWLNVWTGWAINPLNEGTWGTLKEMIFEVLCDSNDEVFHYLINWLAFMFQFPERRAETAIVLKGDMGAGKGTLADTILQCVGSHGLHAQSSEQLTGRFNAHMQDLIFLFSDEAISPGDKAGESRLKAFITERTLSIEGKGANAIQSKNFLHILMATNDRWAVPMSLKDRRFLVLNCNRSWVGKTEKWAQLRAELEANDGQGYRRFLHDMLTHDFYGEENWHPRNKIPETEGNLEEKLNGLEPLGKFLFECCFTRTPPAKHVFAPPPANGEKTNVDDEADWEQTPIRFFVEDFREAFTSFCHRANFSSGGNNRSSTLELFRLLKSYLPARCDIRAPIGEDRFDLGQHSSGRAPCIEIPSLTVCRKTFDTMLKGSVPWDGERQFDFQ